MGPKEPEGNGEPVGGETYKIGIITGTVSQGEEGIHGSPEHGRKVW